MAGSGEEVTGRDELAVGGKVWALVWPRNRRQTDTIGFEKEKKYIVLRGGAVKRKREEWKRWKGGGSIEGGTEKDKMKSENNDGSESLMTPECVVHSWLQ
ncbi:hypothetical protein RRG08_020876 [Elysia crispata]|uniref:Uncharacterized protein n=1 Tax=Elysia crispata TaxID=231223 RepID=A0AAE0XW67_9GAST|nr:hypothetical protein RRG08_020876 [Elysia crispata]